MKVIYVTMCLLFTIVQINAMDYKEVILNNGNRTVGSFKEISRIDPLSIRVDHMVVCDNDLELKGYNVRSLTFRNCEFGGMYGFLFLSGLPIEDIEISTCGLKSKNLDDLFEYLGTNALKRVNLSGNILNDDEDILFKSLHSACAYSFGLEYLNLQDNGLSAKTIKKIKEDPDISSIPELKI